MSRPSGEVPRVLCVGLTTIDHIWRVDEFPPRRSRTQASDHVTSGGGPAATAAVTAARLGADTALWTLVGTDVAGDRALTELAAHGVDLTVSERLRGGRTAVSGVIVNADGERYIFPFFGDALRDVGGEDVELAQVERFQAVLVDMRLPQLTTAVLEAATRAGVPTVSDVSAARYWELAGGVDHLIASQECAAEVLGRDDPGAALAALRHREGQVVGITLGERGLLLEVDRTAVVVPAFAVAAVDTTGAGDVFHGAYAYGLARGLRPVRAAELASATAALACTGMGREAIPDLEAVHALLARSERRTST
ncbi:MAG TPA: PfkB family carbohydrate kinase [Trueperaceae bacterium]|nr:PfkB family carbohydrate kinase [Trueperaceae bacterium]